jgi:hypothetical protein
VMREPCYSSKLKKDQNPYDSTWQNCRIDYEEPAPLSDQQALENFKKLCSPLYKDDQMPLCCSANQIFIMKKDLAQAEALLGSCASCYLNFRMLWCHMTCDPNQHEFLVATHFERRLYNNFTEALSNYQNNKLLTQEDEEYSHEDDMNGNSEMYDEMKQKSKHLDQINENNFAKPIVNVTNHFLEENQEISNYEDSFDETINDETINDEPKRKRRQLPDSKTVETLSFSKTSITSKTSAKTSKAINMMNTKSKTISTRSTSAKSATTTTTTTTMTTTTTRTRTTTLEIEEQNERYVDVVTVLEYHIREEFVLKLIESCK